MSDKDLSYVQGKYYEFIKQNGYVPRAFYPYEPPNGVEHFDIHPTITATCGLYGGSGSMSILVDDDGNLVEQKIFIDFEDS